VTDYCVYPPEAVAGLPRIGAYLNPDIERMLSLRPDLVVLIPTQDRVAQRMSGAGVATLQVRNERLDEVLESITTLGDATGHGDRGRLVRQDLEDGLAAVRASVAGRTPTPTLVVIGRGSGDMAGIFAVGPGAFLDEILTAAGGINVLDGALGLYPQVPLEEVLSLAPEVIIEVVVPPSLLQPAEIVDAWSSLSTVPAVRDGRVHVVTEDYLLIPGPRAVRTAERLAPLLHRELAADGPPTTEGAAR
jgi:iron complex transport system substrate-binding protein